MFNFLVILNEACMRWFIISSIRDPYSNLWRADMLHETSCKRICASFSAKLALKVLRLLHVTRMSFDVFWLMKDCLAFPYTWSARIRLRECAEINFLSFSRLLDTLRLSENISVAALHSPFHLMFVNLLICFSIPMTSKRPQGLLCMQCWRSPSGRKDSSAGNSEDFQAATRTPEQAIILKIDSFLNNQESYRQSSSKALVEEAEVKIEITPEIKQNQAIQFSFPRDTTQLCSKYM
jgi:hypothetical protein